MNELRQLDLGTEVLKELLWFPISKCATLPRLAGSNQLIMDSSSLLWLTGEKVEVASLGPSRCWPVSLP